MLNGMKKTPNQVSFSFETKTGDYRLESKISLCWTTSWAFE